MSDANQLQSPIAIFPLPSTVFYPNTLLPLHIFESRYRQMVKDALEGSRLIGMVLLKPGWEENYEGRPDVVSVGCVGEIDRAQRLADGKYNIVLKGLSRFRILREISGKPYRLAEVEFLQEINDEPLDPPQNTLAGGLISRYREYVGLLPAEHKNKQGPNLENCRRLSEVVDQIACQFDFKAERKQAFLEEQDVRERADIVLAVLDFTAQIMSISKSNAEKGSDARMN